MEQSKKIVKYISDSISNMSSILFNTSTVEEDDDIEINDIDSLTSKDWSKNEVCEETIVINKNEYDKLLNELSLARLQCNNYKIHEREYLKMKSDYDKTVSYLLENNKTIIKDYKPISIESNVCYENDINRLRSVESRLKSHIKALKKDLFESEQKADAFKCMAMSDIEVLKNEIERLKELLKSEKSRNMELNRKIRRLEDILQVRCEEEIELIEYCKYLGRSRNI